MRHVLVAALAVLCMPPAHGASAPSEEYRSDTASAATRAARSQLRSPGSKPGRTVRLPAPTSGEGDTDGGDAPRSMVHQIGFGRDIAGLGVDVPDQGDLRWRTVSGGRAATLALVSPGAAALRARLEFTALPEGVEVRVYRHPGSGAAAVFVELSEDSGGAFAAPQSASVWTPAVDGQSLAIEFFLPKGVDPRTLKLSIPTVSHLEARPMAVRGPDGARTVRARR